MLKRVEDDFGDIVEFETFPTKRDGPTNVLRIALPDSVYDDEPPCVILSDRSALLQLKEALDSVLSAGGQDDLYT